jgi:hypothetical protein
MAISRDLVGADLNAVYGATEVLPMKLGYKVSGDDGRDYILARASAAVAANTAVVLTEPAFTVAGGAGAFSTQAKAVTTGQVSWVRSNAP